MGASVHAALWFVPNNFADDCADCDSRSFVGDKIRWNVLAVIRWFKDAVTTPALAERKRATTGDCWR